LQLIEGAMGKAAYRGALQQESVDSSRVARRKKLAVLRATLDEQQRRPKE